MGENTLDVRAEYEEIARRNSGIKKWYSLLKQASGNDKQSKVVNRKTELSKEIQCRIQKTGEG